MHVCIEHEASILYIIQINFETIENDQICVHARIFTPSSCTSISFCLGSAMASPAKKPVVMNLNVVNLQGGFLKHEGVTSGMTLPTKDVNGQLFVIVDRKAYKFKAFLGDDWAMVNHLKGIRNAKVAQFMKERLHKDDILADESLIGLFDDIDEVITLATQVGGEEKKINVLSDWRDQGQLNIELTAENLELLLLKPDVETSQSAKIVPTSTPGIKFDRHKGVVFASFKKGSKKRKYMSEKVHQDGSDLEVQIEVATKKLMKYHHLKLNDEQELEQVAESSDED